MEETKIPTYQGGDFCLRKTRQNMESQELYKRSKKFMPGEGQRGLLYSHNESIRCPSLGINKMGATENETIERLVDVLLEAFLVIKKNEKTRNK